MASTFLEADVILYKLLLFKAIITLLSLDVIIASVACTHV